MAIYIKAEIDDDIIKSEVYMLGDTTVTGQLEIKQDWLEDEISDAIEDIVDTINNHTDSLIAPIQTDILAKITTY